MNIYERKTTGSVVTLRFENEMDMTTLLQSFLDAKNGSPEDIERATKDINIQSTHNLLADMFMRTSTDMRDSFVIFGKIAEFFNETIGSNMEIKLSPNETIADLTWYAENKIRVVMQFDKHIGDLFSMSMISIGIFDENPDSETYFVNLSYTVNFRSKLIGGNYSSTPTGEHEKNVIEIMRKLADNLGFKFEQRNATVIYPGSTLPYPMPITSGLPSLADLPKPACSDFSGAGPLYDDDDTEDDE